MIEEQLRVSGDGVNLAILIRKFAFGTHTGIIHRMENTLCELDLRFHEDLNSEELRKQRFCVVPLVEPEEMDDVRAVCRQIARRQREHGYRIPYAFGAGDGCYFDPKDGSFVLGEGFGLTCSSFVLKVFEAGRLPLVDLLNWPHRASDGQLHALLIREMEKRRVSKQHIDRVAASLPCIRVRPEEVAAAGLMSFLPAEFSKLEFAGRWVLDQLPSE